MCEYVRGREKRSARTCALACEPLRNVHSSPICLFGFICCVCFFFLTELDADPDRDRPSFGMYIFGRDLFLFVLAIAPFGSRHGGIASTELDTAGFGIFGLRIA